ncbi:MAG TPA: shikimate dehydrogenase [Solirubrobacterales bacterium]|jgi:shikimate dehydrogenase|nr:shikimate dehydrogenase [Solirubrobacterales bacterium]
MPGLAVIGHPVAHSRSPDMQTAALAELGLAGEWIYVALDVEPEDFEAEIAEMAATEEYAGVNVTVPHKEAALAMADEVSDGARAIGAANTLSFRDGRIVADNTDAGGLLRSLPASLTAGGDTGEAAAPARRALVLGAGGAARAAIWALAQGGEGSLDEEGEPTVIPSFEVDVWNRTTERAEAVAAELGAHAVTAPDATDYALIVNTTAVGLGGEDPFEHLPLTADSFAPGQVVVDMVYGEEPSPLLAAAEAAGAVTVDGLEMLVQQGALSLRIWTGEEPSLEAMRAAVRR